MSKDNSGPAFPFQLKCGDGGMISSDGMSLRDYFAAQALSGIAHDEMLASAITDEECQLLIDNAANLSYRLADAMLEARK